MTRLSERCNAGSGVRLKSGAGREQNQHPPSELRKITQGRQSANADNVSFRLSQVPALPNEGRIAYSGRVTTIRTEGRYPANTVALLSATCTQPIAAELPEIRALRKLASPGSQRTRAQPPSGSGIILLAGFFCTCTLAGVVKAVAGLRILTGDSLHSPLSRVCLRPADVRVFLVGAGTAKEAMDSNLALGHPVNVALELAGFFGIMIRKAGSCLITKGAEPFYLVNQVIDLLHQCPCFGSSLPCMRSSCIRI